MKELRLTETEYAAVRLVLEAANMDASIPVDQMKSWTPAYMLAVGRVVRKMPLVEPVNG